MPAAVTVSAAPSSHSKAEHWANDTGTKFHNPWPSARGAPSPVDVAKFMWNGLWIKQPDLADISSFVRQETPDFTPPLRGAKATWLGHACVLLQLPPANDEKRGLNILFDPVFSDRCGPSQYFGAPRRYTPVPCGGVDGLPEIDLAVISHNHYDHLDLPTLRALWGQQRDHIPSLLMPLNTKRLIDFVPEDKIRELDWWESVTVTSPQGSAEFTATPAQHMTARTPFDLACSLWCSWAIRSLPSGPSSAPAPTSDGEKREEGEVRIWFSGDTGYSAVERDDDYSVDPDRPFCPEFKKIGERLGPFDLAFLPIGAYAPRRFLSTVHTAPVDAVRIFKDIKAKKAFAIHWGTWNLSHEPLSEPPRMLAQVASEMGLAKDDFEAIALGGSVSVEP